MWRGDVPPRKSSIASSAKSFPMIAIPRPGMGTWCAAGVSAATAADSVRMRSFDITSVGTLMAGNTSVI